MKVLPLEALLSVACLLLSEASVLKYGNSQQEPFVYLENIKILHQLLMTDCPDMFENKRQLDNDVLASYQAEAIKKTYLPLLNKLIACQKENSENSKNMTTHTSTAASSSTPSITTKPTATTTTKLVPSECKVTTNLTESWRLDHSGSDIKPGGPHSSRIGWNCDLHKDLQWFRFTEKAGNIPQILCCCGVEMELKFGVKWL